MPNDASPSLVFVHGFALDARMWRKQVPAFAETHRVLTLDLPGFGPQAAPPGERVEIVPAEAIARALDVAGLVKAHLVANSYGAAAVVDFALANPRRVGSLTLVGPSLLGKKSGFESWMRAATLAADGDRGTACEVWLEDPLFDGVRSDDALFEEVRQIVLDYQGGHWTSSLATRWLEADPASRLGELDVPALVVSGEGDLPAFILMAEAYAKGLPRAKRQIVQGAGHFPGMERPEAFNEVLRAFLAAL